MLMYLFDSGEQRLVGNAAAGDQRSAKGNHQTRGTKESCPIQLLISAHGSDAQEAFLQLRVIGVGTNTCDLPVCVSRCSTRSSPSLTWLSLFMLVWPPVAFSGKLPASLILRCELETFHIFCRWCSGASELV